MPDFVSLHEPSRLRVADPRSGPGLCEAQRLMAPMRDSGILAAFHEPGGARLRRALTDSCGWEIRARRSLAPPFMVQMRGCKTVETLHEPDFGRDLTLVGTSRCDVPAREAAGGIIAPLSAARTAQRYVPT